jgi:hypothetical protein
VAHHVHPRARVTAVAPLPGGITADMDRVTLDSPAGLKDVVLRRWPGEDWAEGLVTREASALTGQPDLSPADMRSRLGQLATTQAAIHAVPDHPQTRWDGWYDEGRPLDWLTDRGLRGRGLAERGHRQPGAVALHDLVGELGRHLEQVSYRC